MSIRFPSLVLAVTLSVSSSAALANSSMQNERIAASYVLALGRVPSAAEMAEAEKAGELPISELVSRLRQRLQSDAALKDAVAVKAWKDAFGRERSAGELSKSVEVGRTYTELMQSHIQILASDPTEYEKVLERAYRLVIGRGVYPGETAYWKKHDTLPYTLLVGCIEDWGRRNAPGLMETTGTATVSVNSNYLTTVRLSPAIAVEARKAAGMPTAEPADLIAATGRTLVAAGAANLVSGGRIPFVATGGPNIIPATSMN
jgi:hypothetical protein